MNRFEYSLAQLSQDEVMLVRDNNVRLYNGDEKVRICAATFDAKAFYHNILVRLR